LDFDYDNLIANYSFDETCQGSVPQAIFAFLISTSFEDAIRTAVSMGGDADTMAAIAGSIAGAYYGVPENLINEAKQYLTKDLLEIIEKFDSVQYILAKSQNDI
jgi:type I restriction enzyme M protein